MDSVYISWEELLGCNDWEGLLDPLDQSLRKLILKCGDFSQAAHDAFDNDPYSKYCGFCRYGKKSFLEKVSVENASDFEVVSYLYGSAKVSARETYFVRSKCREAWDRESNWIGFIASTSDEASRSLGRREIYVAWRGTRRSYEWIDEMGAKLESIQPLLCNEQAQQRCDVPKVMRGWVSIYMTDDPKSSLAKLSAREQLLTKIHQLREKYRDEKLSIIFCGHSLGASLSILSAFDVVENGIRDIPVAAIALGSPRVGNEAFRRRCILYPNLKILRVTNKIDIVPHYPSRLLGYVNIGTELRIDTRKSPHLKPSKNPSDWHNLQGMMHVVAGWTGEKGEFKLKVNRSVALVNKHSNFLRDECHIPGSWWILENKGMARREDGEWALRVPELEDQPIPES
ncbi:hypothetical protein MLD38_003126 [Melastoma candidum]|uniref:Uncharacterized protein n=1 Tax=Melastoma candidum TaxID=119954 RepID=A0ACB9S1L4_9MYRT|nr:hypothetical protein MLD38_003126 [Melastoma candidum]